MCNASQGSDAKRHVFQHFDKNPTEPEYDDEPESGIVTRRADHAAVME